MREIMGGGNTSYEVVRLHVSNNQLLKGKACSERQT